MKQVHRRLISLTIAVFGFLLVANFVGQEQEVLKVEAEAESKDAKIYSFLSPLEIDAIEIVNQHGRFELTRERSANEEVGRWRLLKPNLLDADLLVVEGILAQALPVRRRLTLPNPDNLSLQERLKNYELAPPMQSLSLKGGSKTETIDFGMSNAFDKSLYAHLQATQEIVTVADSLRHQLRKSLFDLRNKQLSEFERERVTSLAVVHGARRLEFSKVGDRWSLRDGKMEAPVATDRMEDLLQDLRALKFNRIIAERSHSSRVEEFPKDTWTFELSLDEGKGDSLILGLTTVDEMETLMGYRAQGGPVGELVKGRWPSLLKGGFMGLVERRILPFDLGEATSLEISRGEESLQLRQTDTGDWVMAGGAFQIDQARLKGLFHTMNSLEQIRPILLDTSIEDAVNQRAISKETFLVAEYEGKSYRVHPQSGEEPNELWVDGQVIQVDATRLADVLWAPSDYLVEPKSKD